MRSNKLFNQSMQDMRTLIRNSVEQEEIKTKIAPHGYTDEKMGVLNELLEATEEAAAIQAEEYLQKKHASDHFMEAYLEAEGIGLSQLAKVSVPVGLDLGAESPEEIAISIAAEMIAARKNRDVAAIKNAVHTAGSCSPDQPAD